MKLDDKTLLIDDIRSRHHDRANCPSCDICSVYWSLGKFRVWGRDGLSGTLNLCEDCIAVMKTDDEIEMSKALEEYEAPELMIQGLTYTFDSSDGEFKLKPKEEYV